MPDPRDYKLDVSTRTEPTSASGAPAPQPSPGGRGGKTDARPFVSVLFACCNVYQRIYRSADGTRYDGRCPRCGKPVRFLVGAGGPSERAFVVE